MSSIRAAETRAEAMPVDEKESIKEDEIETVNEREQLYMDVLYSITNTVGCQQPGGQVVTDMPNGVNKVQPSVSNSQFAHYKDEMLITAQRAFGVTPDRHYRLLHAAAEEKPKIIVLSVIVQEAEGLEAKDANGMLKTQMYFPPNSNLLNVLLPKILIVILVCKRQEK